ncbi:MAG: hypothetical protein H0W12_06920 [Chitinophagaceae bacterium]|nr:hypothetical protein [Chitinophagaceae bacterium]
MKITLIVLLAFFSMLGYGQKHKIAELSDNRNQRESFSKIPQHDIRADLASFTMGGVDESVGKGDISRIPFSSFGGDFMTFEGDGIKATIVTSDFNPAKHKLEYDEKYLVRIDRKPFYGAYGSMPKKNITQVTMVIDKDSVSIPVAAYADLYNLKLTYKDKFGTERSTNGIYRSKDGHRVYLYLFCKDTTGSYEVTFVIQDKKYLRRVLDFGFM